MERKSDSHEEAYTMNTKYSDRSDTAQVSFMKCAYCYVTLNKKTLKTAVCHSLVLHHAPLLSCSVLAELHLFLMAIPSAAAEV